MFMYLSCQLAFCATILYRSRRFILFGIIRGFNIPAALSVCPLVTCSKNVDFALLDFVVFKPLQRTKRFPIKTGQPVAVGDDWVKSKPLVKFPSLNVHAADKTWSTAFCSSLNSEPHKIHTQLE